MWAMQLLLACRDTFEEFLRVLPLLEHAHRRRSDEFDDALQLIVLRDAGEQRQAQIQLRSDAA